MPGAMGSPSIFGSTEFISSLAGAAAGASLAFLTNALADIVKQRNAQHAAILKGQYTLASQSQSLQALGRQLKDAIRAGGNNALSVQRILYRFTPLRVNFAELSFLATTEDPDILNRILVAEGCFETTVHCLENYNNTKERLENAGIPVGFDPKTMKGHMALDAKGVILTGQVLQSISDTLESLNDSIAKLDAAFIDLQKLGKKLLFEKKFLRVLPKGAGASEAPRREI